MNPHNSYEYFNTLEQLTKPNWSKTPDGLLFFSRFIPSGDCEFFDYNRGFHFVKVWPVYSKDTVDKFNVRIVYRTPDDGDYGGWSNNMERTEAEAIVKAVGEIYSELDKLPNEKIMNHLLKNLNIKVGYE